MIMVNVKSLMKSLGIKSGNEIEFEEYSDVHKSESENPKDPKFEYFKKKILDHLAELEKQENKAVSKSIDIEEWIQKANYPVGTVRIWNGQKFKKITPKKWARVYESESRGAKMAIAALRRKAASCNNSEELYQLCLAHKSRFLDKDKRPLPFMQEFSEYVSGLNDKKEPSTVRPAKKTTKKTTTKTKKKEEPKKEHSMSEVMKYFSAHQDEVDSEVKRIADTDEKYLRLEQAARNAYAKVSELRKKVAKDKKLDDKKALKEDRKVLKIAEENYSKASLEQDSYEAELQKKVVESMMNGAGEPAAEPVSQAKDEETETKPENNEESENTNAFFKGTNTEEAVEKYASDKILKSARKKVDVSSFCSKDYNRLAMSGIYYGEGKKVATNARILLVEDADYPASYEGKVMADEKLKAYYDRAYEREKAEYDRDLADAKKKGTGSYEYNYLKDKGEPKRYISENGEIDAPFPNYKRVIPDTSEDYSDVTKGFNANIDKLEKLAYLGKKLQGKTGVPARIKFMGKIIPAENLSNVISFAKTHGGLTAVHFSDEYSPMVFEGKGFKIVCTSAIDTDAYFDAESGNYVGEQSDKVKEFLDVSGTEGKKKGETLKKSFIDFARLRKSFQEYIGKSNESDQLEYYKKQLLAHLSRLEKKEGEEVKKAENALEMLDIIMKAGYTIGTIREWKGKKFRKIAPNKWRRIYEKEDRGAKKAITHIKRQIENAKDLKELGEIISQNLKRFEVDGKPLPIAKEILDKAKGKQSALKTVSESPKAAESPKPDKNKNNEKNGTKEEVFGSVDKNDPGLGIETRKWADEINAVARKGEITVGESVYKIDKNEKEWVVQKEIENAVKCKHALSVIDKDFTEEAEKAIEKKAKDRIEKMKESIAKVKEKGDFNKLNDAIKYYEEKIRDLDSPSLDDFLSSRKKQLKSQVEAHVKENKLFLGRDSDDIDSLGNAELQGRLAAIHYNDTHYVFSEYLKLLKDAVAQKTSSRAESIKKLVSDKLDEYKKDWYAKSVAESTVRKYGRKKLEQLAALNIKSDDEYKDYLANRVKEVEEKDGDKIEDDTIGNAVWKHVVSSFMKQLATKKLESMNANETMMDAPVDPKDLAEAQNIIGGDVAAILGGRDTFGNKKQTLADKVVRRVRNNPGVARAMLVYIKQEQEKAGKKIFTEKHKIWEYLPKLNEKAAEAAEKGESETKTGVSGALYEGADGTTVVENKDWGRYQISFPGKPDSATISALKSNGFRWSPKTKTWVCYNTANGERGLKNVVEKLGLKKPGVSNDDPIEKLKNWKAPKTVEELVGDSGFQTELKGNSLKVSNLINGKFKKLFTSVRGFDSMQPSQKMEIAKFEKKGLLTADERKNVFESGGKYYLIKKGKGTQWIDGKGYSNSDTVIPLTDGVQKSLLERTRELLKAFGHKDTSKLTKKQITDKNGHRKTVYVKNGEETDKNHGGKTEENNTSKDGHFTVGDVVSFADNGAEKQGKVLGGKGDIVQISGTGDSSGIRYTVKVSDVKEKKQNADGTIPASSFNASDYKKSFTDPKCTNDAEGIKHVYALLGTDGAETQAMVEKKLYEQVRRMKKGDTQTRNTIDGEYTPERKALHEAIINSILSPEKIEACKPKNGEKPKFVMFGGRGGSGKSWFTDKKRAAADGREVMFDADKYLVLDADALKEYIPEYEGWNAGEVHEESSYLNKRIKAKAFDLGLNIIIDGTMNYNPKKPDKVRKEMLEAKDKGYSLEAHYMFAPIQKSCVNAMQRFKTKAGDYSGRLVPTDILLSMQDNEKSFDSVKDICDDWSFRDNQDFKAKLISKKGLN